MPFQHPPTRWVSLIGWWVWTTTLFQWYPVTARNMNGGGGGGSSSSSHYKVANSDTFDTNYQDDYFEVYSLPIQTLYSQVHWKAHGDIPLPDDIVQRFANGKVMAITGYEVDQVFRRNTSDEDIPVPITWTYNHHYAAYLLNSKTTRMVQQPVTMELMQKGIVSHAGSDGLHWTPQVFGVATDDDDDAAAATPIPHVHFFSEGNGGEMRVSYHGYPARFAQLIQSPDTFHITPMQIDTWNRDTMKNSSRYQPGGAAPPPPKSSQIPADTAGYNGLIECPCSDRLVKEWHVTYALGSTTNKNNKCVTEEEDGDQIHNATECFTAVQQVIPSNHYQWKPVPRKEEDSTLSSMSSLSSLLAVGCNAQVESDGTVSVIWNEPKEDEQEQQEAAGTKTLVVETKHPQVRLDRTTEEEDEEYVETDALIVPVPPPPPQQQQQVAAAVAVGGFVNMTVTVAAVEAPDAVHLQLVGPSDQWFGVGIGADTMCIHMQADECPQGGPYAIIVTPRDTVVERKLDFHGPGQVLTSNSLTVISNHVDSETNLRTVRLSRPLQGESDKHYTFPNVTAITSTTLSSLSSSSSSNSIPVIMAQGCVGDTQEFAQHCGHTSSTLNFLQVGIPHSICSTGIEGTLGGSKFVNAGRCAAFPVGTLLEQGNPTCWIQSYRGGLRCCRHGQSLLDTNQEIPWKDQPLEYYLKFRLYFQDYQHEEPAVTAATTTTTTTTTTAGSPPTASEDADVAATTTTTALSSSSLRAVASTTTTSISPPSHENLVRFYWATEAFAGEYDIMPCKPGTPPSQCIQVISSQWKVRDFVHDCSIHDASWCTGKGSRDDTKTLGVQLIYAGPHCHAPTCLSMELYNADTGQLLCHVEPIHGTGQGGAGATYDEYGFLAIPPCLWGDDATQGLPPPELLSLDTTLLSIKRNNNTLAHTGEMASWQMRGTIVPRPQQQQQGEAKEEEEKDDHETLFSNQKDDDDEEEPLRE
jgi:hypothetical protein